MIALSGGVDSALVAYAAFSELGAHRAIAITADYRTLSQDELDVAKSVCAEIGIRHIMLEYDELENDNFVTNDNTRCYHCRTELGGRLAEMAKSMDGLWIVVDGTHLDDLGDYRPGIEAMRENHICSPLIDARFTKHDVRTVAQHVGLSIHDRPSNSCLASRIPWGVRITAEKLARIELGERIVRQLSGAKQVRVRDIDGSARIEVEPEILHIFDDVAYDPAMYGVSRSDNYLVCGVDAGSDDDNGVFDHSYQYNTLNSNHNTSCNNNNTADNVSAKLFDVIADRLKMIGFNDVVLDPQGYRTGKLNDVILD